MSSEKFGFQAKDRANHLMDLYWGGSERRITPLTLKIICVNAISVLVLLCVLMTLGQRQAELIEAKLVKVETQITMATLAFSEGAVDDEGKLDREKVRMIAMRMIETIGQPVRVFQPDGTLFFEPRGRIVAPQSKGSDNKDHEPQSVVENDVEEGSKTRIVTRVEQEQDLYAVKVLKDIIRFVLGFMPDKRDLPVYPISDIYDFGAQDAASNAERSHKSSVNQAVVTDYPNISEVMQGKVVVSVWRNDEGRILVSSAAPIYRNNVISGSVLILQYVDDIKRDIENTWLGLVFAFILMLVVIIFISIYLSGMVANPLRKLADAAERVRRGKASYTVIPDFSDRRDEIGELSIALRQMTSALASRMDAIDHFAADVAHELKNPLTSLRSAVETLEVVKSRKDKAKLKEIIKHDLQRLDRLISDISQASRLDSSLSRARPERVNIYDVLQDLIDAYKEPLARGAEGSSDLPTSHRINIDDKVIALEWPVGAGYKNLYVWGIDRRLEQVFQNLVSNALSFSPKGGAVTISLEQKAGTIQDEDILYIVVDDEGPGIPANKLEEIFGRFYSERPHQEAYGAHSGLGLSICRQIVESAGGKIYAENRMDGEKILGARFIVELQRAF